MNFYLYFLSQSSLELHFDYIYWPIHTALIASFVFGLRLSSQERVWSLKCTSHFSVNHVIWNVELTNQVFTNSGGTIHGVFAESTVAYHALPFSCTIFYDIKVILINVCRNSKLKWTECDLANVEKYFEIIFSLTS